MYKFIIYTLLKDPCGREQAVELLHSIYVNARQQNAPIKNTVSDVLVSEQKALLKFAVDKLPYVEWENEIEHIIKVYQKCDNDYSYLLR